MILRVGNNLNTKQEDVMSNKDKLNISLSRATIIIVMCMVMYIILMAFFTGPVKSETKKTLEIDYIKIGWPSQLLYDTTTGCFQGTLRWILMSNPALIGRTPPSPVQRAIIEHCSCVLDRLRTQYNIVEYFNLRSQPEEVMGQLYLSTALMCVQNNGTLQGIITINESTDNSTVIPEKQEDSEESLSDQPKEESPNEDTKPIFQG